MISDLLVKTAHLKREADEPLHVPTAMETVIESMERKVTAEEKKEYRTVMHNGWLDD